MNNIDMEHFLDSPESLLTLCREVIAKLDERRIDAELDMQEKQLKEISNTIEKLERSGISVPDELRALKTGLLAKLSVREDTCATLEKLADGFETILKEMGRIFDNNNSVRPLSRKIRHGSRSKQPKTDGPTLRREIVAALKKMGGRGRVHQVLDEMEKQLGVKLLPRDLETLKSGSIVWQNSAQWERFYMVQDGTLKGDSPHGIWELSEGYK